MVWVLLGRTLHMYPEYFADKPVARLLGKDIQASHINDDVMGRFLDGLYEAGVSGLYQDIAVRVIDYLKLPCSSLNLDTTSFHVDGDYEQDIDSQSIKITRGYSRDHRPELNQVVLNLITENQAGIPLYMQACSDNAQDTEKTVKAHLKSLKAAYKNTYFIADAALYVAQQVKRTKRGRPGANDEYKTTFHITGYIATSLQMRDDEAQTTGLFILATNDLSEELSMQCVLDEYKSQQAMERGFRFLKSPDFLTSSLFLKKAERIESLLMIMTCSLMAYAGIEHLIRKKLAEKNAHFPDMKNKPTQRPTARWVFFCFQGISVLVIDSKIEMTTNIIDRQKIILNVLGQDYWRFYS